MTTISEYLRWLWAVETWSMTGVRFLLWDRGWVMQNMFRQVLRNMPAWGISYSPWVTALCDLPNVVLIPLTAQHIYYFTDRGVWLVGFSALWCVSFRCWYWDIYSTTVKISLITAEGVPTSMHHFRLSAVCFQTSFTAALSLNAYCHTDTYFQCTGGLHDVAILKALQITHYNQFSCELLSFLDLNIHILATKRKKEGFFSQH